MVKQGISKMNKAIGVAGVSKVSKLRYGRFLAVTSKLFTINTTDVNGWLAGRKEFNSSNGMHAVSTVHVVIVTWERCLRYALGDWVGKPSLSCH